MDGYSRVAVALAEVIPQDPLQRFLVFSVISLVGAAFFGLVSSMVETATFTGYKFLERQGLIERLIPKDTTINAYQLATFKTFVASLWLPLMYVCYHLGPLLSSAKPCWNPLVIVPQLWLLAIWHDFHFWAVHATMHKFKVLYRHIHHQHHDHPFGDLHVFQTADMHFVEAFALTMGFYAGLLYLSLSLWGTWDPVLFYAYVILEANMNMGGHCGYYLPNWLQFLVTWGIGNTPWSASSKTHYIHHLDPRSNHALYFIWVDQLAGTYRATHPKVREMSPEAWRDYNNRPFRWIAKRAKMALGI